MRLRTKLLLGLLAISLVPMAIMRFSGQIALREIGHDLGQTFSATLLDNAETELTRLVEDHAQVLRRERLLVQTALRSRVAELESLLAAPGESLAPALCAVPPTEMPASLTKAYCIAEDNGECVPIEPDFDAMTRFPTKEHLTSGRVDRIPLDQLIPQMKSMFAELSGMVLWAAVRPMDGPVLVYPAVRGMAGPLPAWKLATLVPESCEVGGPKWSMPVLDPITRQFVLTVTMSYRDPRSGWIAGVAAFAVPMHAVLHENSHIRALSDDVVSMIVRVEDNPPMLRVVAREQTDADISSEAVERHARSMRRHGQMPGWSMAPKDEFVPSSDPDGYAAVASAILHGKAGVVGMTYKGEPSFWAYAPLNTTRGSGLLLILPKDDLTRQASMAEEYVHERIIRQLRLTGAGLVVLLLLVLTTALLLSNSISYRVVRLITAVSRVARGDFSVRAEIEGKDEIAELGSAFDKMVPALEDRVRLQHSVGLAQEIQQSLLPRGAPNMPGLDLAGEARYSDETGGDLYDFIRFPQAKSVVGIALGDVSGHGVPAALLMASARAALRSRLVSPGWAAEAVTAVNRLVARDTAVTSHFLTLIYLEIDAKTRRVSWVRAGQDPAIVYDPASNSFAELDGRGMALGIDPDAVFLQQDRDLSAGRIILLGTDGIWETRSPEGEMYGKGRLRELIAANAHRSAADIVETVLADLALFRSGLPQEDDVTLVVVKLLDS